MFALIQLSFDCLVSSDFRLKIHIFWGVYRVQKTKNDIYLIYFMIRNYSTITMNFKINIESRNC